jgi:mRNA interferase MazF
MEAPVKTSGFEKGDVVVMHFPFSNLADSKKRPALVLASLHGTDRIVCQITTNATIDDYSITLNSADFSHGFISKSSIIRPNKLFTADESILLYKAGRLKDNKIREVEENIIRMFRE